LENIIRSTIRPFDVIGTNKDAILYVSVLSRKKNKKNDITLDGLLKLLIDLENFDKDSRE
jgi:hypothetical protein